MPEKAESLAKILGRDVSRETVDRLETHRALLAKWNPAINLVSKSTLRDAWSRHILDSTQVFSCAGATTGHWADLGTGGGFPGLVCALLAAELAPDLRFTLVESDRRKTAFLLTVLAQTGVTAEVRPERIEQMPPLNADILSARALAGLTDLLALSQRHLAPEGRCLFPKGARHAEEIAEAQQHWRFKLDQKPSITDPNAGILVLGDLARV